MYDTFPIQNGLICQSQRMIGTFLGGSSEHIFIFFRFTPNLGEVIHFDYYSYFSNGLGTNHQLDFQTRRVFVAEVLFGAVVLPLRKELMTFMTNDPEPLTENTRWESCGQFTLRVSMCICIYTKYVFCVYTVYIFRWYNICIYLYTYPVLANIEIGKDSKAWQKFWILNELALYQCWARPACGFPSYLIELPCKRDDHEWVGYAWSTVYPANMLGRWFKPSNLCGTCPMLY